MRTENTMDGKPCGVNVAVGPCMFCGESYAECVSCGGDVHDGAHGFMHNICYARMEELWSEAALWDSLMRGASLNSSDDEYEVKFSLDPRTREMRDREMEQIRRRLPPVVVPF